VTVYAPLPAKILSPYRGVTWKDLQEFDATLPGLYILVRGIELLERFCYDPQQHVWCVFQDVDTLEPWQNVWVRKIDRIIGLCATHCQYLKDAHPDFADLVSQSSNGIRGDLVDQVCNIYRPERNPHRLMYASSPDRGLPGLLQAFKLIRFLVPDAELHVFYGWDNLDKLTYRASVRWQHARTLKLAQQPGVFLRGRRGQPELYREWLKSGLMCAPTNFEETGYISLLEAQALGAIPIVNPIWAAQEYQVAGIAIEGDGERDALTLRRYAMAAVFLMQNPEGQEEIRGPMQVEARKRFDWSGVITQYEAWITQEGL
jgi:glycosyltransferase involved in cell wall biosynthesis